jgi:hypothetical protein
MDTLKALAVLVAMYRREPMQRGQIVFDAAQLLGPADAGDPRVLGDALDVVATAGYVYHPGLGLYHLTPAGTVGARSAVYRLEAITARLGAKVRL